MSGYVENSKNLEWGGSIPASWCKIRAKFLLKRLRLPPPEGEEVVTAFRDGQVTLRENRRTEGFTFSNKEIGYQGVREGDLVIHSMDGFAGAIGVSESTGKCSPVYVVCETGPGVVARFYAYVMRHMALSGYIASLAKGIRERSTSFGWGEIKEQWLPSLNIDEQKAIADFLDRKTAAIDALIEKKQKLLDLLAEKRAALINQAVTKGLDPNVPMKDSGIPWIGEIPAHWEVKRLKNVLVNGLRNGLFKKKDEYGRGTALVNVGDVYSDTFQVRWENLDRVNATSSEQRAFRVQHGDIFFVRSSLKLEGVAASACLLDPPEKTVFECHLVGARPDINQAEPVYVANLLNSSLTRQRLISLSTTTTMTTIAQDRIADIRLPLPPIDEQHEISKRIMLVHKHLADMCAIVEQQHERLQEYRQALITECVTGKLLIEAEK